MPSFTNLFVYGSFFDGADVMDNQCNDCREVCGSRLTGNANLASGSGRNRLIAAIAILTGTVLALVIAALLS